MIRVSAETVIRVIAETLIRVSAETLIRVSQRGERGGGLGRPVRADRGAGEMAGAAERGAPAKRRLAGCREAGESWARHRKSRARYLDGRPVLSSGRKKALKIGNGWIWRLGLFNS